MFTQLGHDLLPALPEPRSDHPEPPLIVYTGGSSLHNGQQHATCGAGIWVEEDHPMKTIRVPGASQSNQTAKLAAIVVALQSAPSSSDLTIITDSRYAIQTLTGSLSSIEDRGWSDTPNETWLRAAAYHLRRRGTPTRFKWVKGHDGTVGNEGADRLDDIDLTVPPAFDCTGLKVGTISQASTYLCLQDLDTAPPSRHAQVMLDRVHVALEEVNDTVVTDTYIWARCRHPDLRRPVHTFLFKAIHNALRIGDFWSNIPPNRCPHLASG